MTKARRSARMLVIVQETRGHESSDGSAWKGKGGFRGGERTENSSLDMSSRGERGQEDDSQVSTGCVSRWATLPLRREVR